MGRPSVYPTGVTIYNKELANNGYTLFSSEYGATLIDMNGRLVKTWSGLMGNPLKAMPQGQILATDGHIPGVPGAASSKQALLIDWEGNVLWNYRKTDIATFPDGSREYVSKHHHDYEFEHYPVYYTPIMDKDGWSKGIDEERCLLLTHNRVTDLKISDSSLLDERIIEVDMEGNLLWEWNSHEHFEEFGLSEDAKKALFANPMMGGDWIHLNAISTLGLNQWYESGDVRFHPENIICSSRQLNCVFIIEKSSGKIVWRIGPDFTASPKMAKIHQIIGQHHAHMIPQGLPGAGNILIFDNGSFGGFGTPHGTAPDGTNNIRRHYSRVVEINPVTMDLEWEYMKAVRNKEDVNEMNAHEFFSPYISSAQRLPNGNTLITEGADGILIEVTPDKKIIWEFINPIVSPNKPPMMQTSIYRAYRVPYTWVPQLDVPEEVDVIPPDIYQWRVPGSFDLGDVALVATKIK